MYLGCFWGVELVFQRVPGVVETEVGYCQGVKKNPSYEEVCSGSTGHTEAVKVTFDSTAIRYEDLLTVFWDVIDPTALNRQGKYPCGWSFDLLSRPAPHPHPNPHPYTGVYVPR